MARRNIFDRAREFIAGASRKVLDTVTTFFERSDDPVESEELREIIDFERSGADENQPIHNEPDQKTDEQIAKDIIDSDPVVPIFTPEQPDDEGEVEDDIADSEFNVEYGSFDTYDPAELRRILTTFEEAENYASEIPQDRLNLTIVKDVTTGLYRVLVHYEIVISE